MSINNNHSDNLSTNVIGNQDSSVVDDQQLESCPFVGMSNVDEQVFLSPDPEIDELDQALLQISLKNVQQDPTMSDVDVSNSCSSYNLIESSNNIQSEVKCAGPIGPEPLTISLKKIHLKLSDLCGQAPTLIQNPKHTK